MKDGSETPVDIIIQARMGSSRLPGKVLLPFMGTTVLEYLIDRVSRSASAGRVIVATTPNPLDDQIVAVCRERGCLCFRGRAEEDVLGLYHDAAAAFGSRIVVRVCADSPFMDVGGIDALVSELQAGRLDYVGSDSRGTPIGLGCEAFTVEALNRANDEAHAAEEREHVTPYFYRHPELFSQRKIDAIHAPADEVGARLTLDTPEDYEMLSRITELWEGDPLEITTADILRILRENPEIRAINAHIQQRKVPEALVETRSAFREKRLL